MTVNSNVKHYWSPQGCYFFCSHGAKTFFEFVEILWLVQGHFSCRVNVYWHRLLCPGQPAEQLSFRPFSRPPVHTYNHILPPNINSFCLIIQAVLHILWEEALILKTFSFLLFSCCIRFPTWQLSRCKCKDQILTLTIENNWWRKFEQSDVLVISLAVVVLVQ